MHSSSNKELSEASIPWCFNQFLNLVEISGIEPLTSCLQGRRSPSWAKPPYPFFRSGGPKWTRFPAGKPRRLQQSTGLLSRAAFRVLLACRPSKLVRPGLNPYLSLLLKWWAKMDSNHRPHDYQSCALASWAIGPYRLLTSLGTSFAVPSKLNNALTSLPLYWP